MEVFKRANILLLIVIFMSVMPMGYTIDGVNALVELPVNAQNVRISSEALPTQSVAVKDGKLMLKLDTMPLFIEEMPETSEDMPVALSGIFKNPDMEKSLPLELNHPEGWETLNELSAPFADSGAIYEWDDKIYHSGRHSLKIKKSNEKKKAAWVQKIAGVDPAQKYEVSVWVKMSGLKEAQGKAGAAPFASGIGMAAVFFVDGVKDPVIFEAPILQKAQEWHNQRFTFVVPEGSSGVTITLEMSGKGIAWWDDIAIRKLVCVEISGVNKIKENELDQYGGWKQIKGKATGFFHTEKINNRWWIITPEGNGFIVIGLQHMFRKDKELERIEEIISMPTSKDNMRERFQILREHIPRLAVRYGVDIGELLPYEEAKKIEESIVSEDAGAAQKIDNIFKRVAEIISQSISQKEWIRESTQRLKEWGFNTLSHNSLFRKFAYDAKVSPSLWGFPFITPEVRVPVKSIKSGNILDDIWAFPDIFDQRFKEVLDYEFSQTASRLKDDPWLLGYFFGNELPWDGDPDEGVSIFDMFFALPEQRAGKKALVEFLKKEYHNNVEIFNEAWGTKIKNFNELITMPRLAEGIKNAQSQEDKSEFLRLVAETYFKLNYEAVKKYDPNHMILGVRFRGHAVPREVLEVIGNYTDIVSFQPYDPIAPLEWLEETYQFHHKPILITEFSFKAQDSGLANTVGAGFILKTQKDRALWYERYVSHLLSSPDIVGQIWYKYMDDPPGTQGENSNFGLVNGSDVPYRPLVEKIKEVNSRIYNLVADTQLANREKRGSVDLIAEMRGEIQRLIQGAQAAADGPEEYSRLLKKTIAGMAKNSDWGYVEALNLGKGVRAYKFQKKERSLYVLWKEN